MTGFGSLLWIIAVGALVYFMMRKGGGCCGGGHDQGHDNQTNKNQPRGGCCG
jgi:hypothetical protein